VMSLHDDRKASFPVGAGGQAFNEVHLPQRLVAIEPFCEQTARESGKLRVLAWAGERRVAEVVANIEVWIVYPNRSALLEGHERQSLAIARNTVQARLKEAEELVVAWRLSRENHHRSDVHVRAAALKVQKGGVEPREAIWIRHRASLMASVSNLTQPFANPYTTRV
jgi:hypothetical protein